MAAKKQTGKGAKAKAAKSGRKAPATKAKATKANGASPARIEAKTKRKQKPVDVEPLRKTAEEAKASLAAAENEANALRLQARGIEAAAKKAYAEAVAPYRDACRSAGLDCEFAGARSENVTPAVRFLVEKVKDGVKVAIKGQPKTEEVIPMKALSESVSRAAYAYTDKHIGPKEKIGNKGGGLGNRIRAALTA